MSVVTSQQISKLYDRYSEQDVLFNKDINRALLLNTKGIHLRCLGYQWPCILYSSSMTSAKLVVNVKTPIKKVIEQANRMVSLNYSFLQKDKANPISFFMKAKVVSYAPYHPEKPDLNFLNLEFAHRPPDELIFRLGELLEAQTNSNERKDERIVMNPSVQQDMRLHPKEGVAISIDNIPRKCILRDISFGGAKVIIFGVPTFLVNKPSLLTLKFEDPDLQVQIAGKVLRFEEVQGRKDLAAFAIQFDEKVIPTEYKLRLNQYLKQAKRK